MTLIDDTEQFNSVTPVLFVIPAVCTVVFDVTIILAVDEQPFAPVTVTVYVPAVVMVALALFPKPLFHEYETPPVAVTLIAETAHVSSDVPVLLVMFAVGKAVLEVIVMLEVEVHPLVPVTVTV